MSTSSTTIAAPMPAAAPAGGRWSFDAAEAELPLSIIREFRAKGLTFVFVEHIMPIVMSMADRIAVINFGEKIAEGTPASIVRDPNVQKSYLGGEIEIA